MISLREGLNNIKMSPNASFRYSDFCSRPPSLRAAIRSMQAPRDFQVICDSHLDEDWTESCQGVAYDGARWIFSCNKTGNPLYSSPAALYVFHDGTTLHDSDIVQRIDVPNPDFVDPSWETHVGQITYFEGRVYVSYFYFQPISCNFKWTGAIVLRDNGGSFSFERYIPLWAPVSPSTGKYNSPEFQAINPWDRRILTCPGGDDDWIHEFFMHDLDTGFCTGTLALKEPCRAVQGACCSPNGHLYVAVDTRFPDPDSGLPAYCSKYKWIFCYSLLNGALLGKISVTAESGDHELEGICFADVEWPDGRKAQLHAVLLENILVAKDNIWFKSYSSDQPDLA